MGVAIASFINLENFSFSLLLPSSTFTLIQFHELDFVLLYCLMAFKSSAPLGYGLNFIAQLFTRRLKADRKVVAQFIETWDSSFILTLSDNHYDREIKFHPALAIH